MRFVVNGVKYTIGNTSRFVVTVLKAVLIVGYPCAARGLHYQTAQAARGTKSFFGRNRGSSVEYFGIGSSTFVAQGLVETDARICKSTEPVFW